MSDNETTAAPRGQLLKRHRYLLLVVLVFTVVLGFWTLRTLTWNPDSGADGSDASHYLPIKGGELFTLKAGAHHTYEVVSEALSCEQTRIHLHGEDMDVAGRTERLVCGPYIFRLEDSGGWDYLSFSGLMVDIPARIKDAVVVGSGRHADVVGLVPGMGVEHLRVEPADACATAVNPSLPQELGLPDDLACIVNQGLRDSVVIDNSEWLEPRLESYPSLAPPLRFSLDHGQRALVRGGDVLWLGFTPFQVTKEKDHLALEIPDGDGWLNMAGRREWTNLQLPRWRLAPLRGDQRTGSYEFHSREELFWTLPPFANNIEGHRYEYQQEEWLQAFVDHEILCWNPDQRALFWNFETASGCDGRPGVAPPPQDLYREARERSSHRVTAALVQQTNKHLAHPTTVWNPGELAFVFDWENSVISGSFDEENPPDLQPVPVRLLGVRHLYSRHSPGVKIRKSAKRCDLANKDDLLPPVDLAQGSTSPYLEVEVANGLQLVEGAKLLLASTLAVGGQPTGQPATLCLGSGQGLQKLNVGRPFSKALGAVSLGTLVFSGGEPYWAAQGTPTRSGNGDTCLSIALADGHFQVMAHGAAGGVQLGGTALAAGDRRALANGDRLSLKAGSRELRAVFMAAPMADRAAETQVDDDARRYYPFGDALAGVLGMTGVYGGLESTLQDQAWKAAREAWRDSCGADEDEHGVRLTLRGDLQRLLYEEMEVVRGACATGDADVCRHKPTNPDGPWVQAVLLDANSGRILAAANAPSFDPSSDTERDYVKNQLVMNSGNWEPDLRFQNLAFNRADHAGSVYKLATSYALARAGRLDDAAATSPDHYWCSEVMLTQVDPGDPSGEALRPRQPAAFEGTCKQSGSVPMAVNPAVAFLDAFKKSRNLFFALATLDLSPGSGVEFAKPLGAGGAERRLPANPLALDGRVPPTGVWMSGNLLGITLAADFDPVQDLGAADNQFVQVLRLLGHRFFYPRAANDGSLRRSGTINTQTVDAVGAHEYPTQDDRQWLLGLGPSGFRYPGAWGPESFGLAGSLPERLELSLFRGENPDKVTALAGSVDLINYLRSGYGMGGIQASALSLAVLGSPMARDDGSVVAPDIIQRKEQGPGARIVTPELLNGAQRAILVEAMKAVISGGTGNQFFANAINVRDAIGGKTGTFARGRVGQNRSRRYAAGWRRELLYYACGVEGAQNPTENWTLLQAALGGLRGSAAQRYQERTYIDTFIKAVSTTNAEKLPLGFGASANACNALNPGRARVSTQRAGVDGGVWLDAIYDHTGDGDGFIRPHKPTTYLDEGSSFIAVVFDPLVPGTSPEQERGKGWVLAVIIDGHDEGAKWVSVRVLERLREHLAVREAALAAMAPAVVQ